MVSVYMRLLKRMYIEWNANKTIKSQNLLSLKYMNDISQCLRPSNIFYSLNVSGDLLSSHMNVY